MCNIHLGYYCKISKLKATYIYNMHSKARGPAGMTALALHYGHGRGHAGCMTSIVRDDCHMSTPKDLCRKTVATLAHLTPIACSLCLQFLSFRNKAEYISSATFMPSPSIVPWPSNGSVAAWGCSRLNVNGMGLGVEFRSWWDNVNRQKSECIRSLLPGVYYYYLYLSSI